ncbi:MAG: cardiolipin synthase ClsB [Pseudomonas sp.]|uniref:cardiolipin synthase ClsB n=1 Tax=Pseudomonas sp. TaxID=306 RepID=UPI0033955A25
MTTDWKDGNRVELLENGEEFYPRVWAALEQAREEILLETFILFEDKVGNRLHQALIDAAKRGVRVEITVDGFGSSELTPAFIGALTAVGVRFRMFDPGSKLVGMRLNIFRRLHRKILVVDGHLAFIGGINFSADHLGDYGPDAKQDYAIEIRGPVVEDIHRFALAAIAPSEAPQRRWPWGRRKAPGAVSSRTAEGTAQALFVTRDNQHHRNDIEQHYLEAIRTARQRVVIANAYFFPGYRLLRELRNAARRGVEVRLILQGQPDMPIVKVLARMLYNYLLRDGVQISEYCQRPLHGKVALVDDEWATVGSSNLDPLSLALNLEANLLIRDRAFNQELSQRLDQLVHHHCTAIGLERMVRGYFWRAPLAFLCFHFLRTFPAMAGWLPAHRPRLALLQDEPSARDHSPLSHESANEQP